MGSSTIGSSGASSSPSTIAQTYTATAANTFYTSTNVSAYIAATYTISCATSVTTYVDFYSGTTLLASGVTTSGTVTVSLASAPTKIAYWTSSGTNTIINIQLVGQSISSTLSGTVDTLTTSGTYNQTGPVYAVIVGGGGGSYSGDGSNQGYSNGGGGGSGGVQSARMVLNGPTSYTIGAGGVAYNGTGGATTFGSYTSNGGGPGGTPSSYTLGTPNGGAPGTPGGGKGYGYISGLGNNSSASVASAFNPVVVGTTGGGGAGNSAGPSGSGIGTGGNQSSSGTGYGAGAGGGPALNSGSGAAGTAGVIYVLRGF